MRILMIAINDPAGTAIGFTQAITRHTPHTCRLVTLETRYDHNWQKDIHLPDIDLPDKTFKDSAACDALHDLLVHSDVFHFHMTADEHLRLGPFLPADFIAGKAIVHHHHGHPDFRENPGKYARKYKEKKRSNLLVSTPDLLGLLPAARWQPNPVDQSAPCLTPQQKPLPDAQASLTVSHSPTRRELKNTADFIAVVRKLCAGGMPVTPDIIDNVAHGECLKRKKDSDAVFDHMQGYYGVSSLEGLSLGLPTIAGLSRDCIDHMQSFTQDTPLPWLIAHNPDELSHCLGTLQQDPALRSHIGERSRTFMETCWSQERVARYLNAFYSTLT